MCGLKTMYFTMNLEDSENQSSKWSQFDWFSKKLKNIWFFIFFWSKKQFLSTVSQKWMQNGPGLDSGWVGLAGLGRAGPGLCLGLVLSTSGPESHQIKLPGSGFPDFWSQRQKVFKSSFLGFVLSASGANAWKSSNQASWDRFSWLLEPTPESLQIKLPGIRFVDFWSQGQKVIKSSLLGLVFSITGANARNPKRKHRGRADWAGLAGWLGWLAGLPGLACWAGWAGPGGAGTLPGIGFVDF